MTTDIEREHASYRMLREDALLESWQPVGISELEPAARDALHSDGCRAVTAGPGAGKTEFLAQKATYLLHNGLVPGRQRILAISFKRDAAATLARRVRERVPEHADRFVSMTFDKFAKGLVDRFRSSLPAPWSLSGSYAMDFPTAKSQVNYVKQLMETSHGALRSGLGILPKHTFRADVVGTWKLPFDPLDADLDDAATFAALRCWQDHYWYSAPQQVDFVMLNRLAELLGRAVPQLRRALHLTYPVVFVDEFQDTTAAQFSFLKSIFRGHATITVVGDRKQRIMGFAGAMDDAFPNFVREFDAKEHTLTWNLRSSPPLVALHHVVATRLDPSSINMESKAIAEDFHQPVRLWNFSSATAEADHIATWIAREITGSRRSPADFALVVRQKTACFESRFRYRLREHGIRLRNDDVKIGNLKLQDLLKHDVTRLLLGTLKLANQPHGLAQVWDETSTLLRGLRGVSPDDESDDITDELSGTTRDLRAWLREHSITDTPPSHVVDQAVGHLGLDSLRSYTDAAGLQEDFESVRHSFTQRLADVARDAPNWAQALDDFDATDAVNLLTVHRSKGLEYHTVFFIGLDDDQWWSHHDDRSGSISTFFVGISRAAQRLIFTSTSPKSHRSKIADFYAMLSEAGIPEIDL